MADTMNKEFNMMNIAAADAAVFSCAHKALALVSDAIISASVIIVRIIAAIAIIGPEGVL